MTTCSTGFRGHLPPTSLLIVFGFVLAAALNGAAPAIAQANNDISDLQPNVTPSERIWAQNLSLSAGRGSAQAQYELGRAFLEGRVFKQNVDEAVHWTRAAAEQGLAEAEVNLAVMYNEGRGVPRDDAQSFAWNLKAADRGNVNAEYNIGYSYALGQGVKKQ
jgi:TPR repeat protein